jgi:hypothetical protein
MKQADDISPILKKGKKFNINFPKAPKLKLQKGTKNNCMLKKSLKRTRNRVLSVVKNMCTYIYKNSTKHQSFFETMRKLTD